MDELPSVHDDQKEKPDDSDVIVIYEQEGVFIHFSTLENSNDVILGGNLKILEKNEQHFLCWNSIENEKSDLSSKVDNEPLSSMDDSISIQPSVSPQVISSEMRQPSLPKQQPLQQNSDPGWMVVGHGSNIDDLYHCEQTFSSVDEQNYTYDFEVPFDDLSVIRKSKKNVGWKYIVINLNDGASLPPLHFHQGGCKKFLKALKTLLVLTPSLEKPNVLTVTSRNEAALNQSLNELQVFDNKPTANVIQQQFASVLSNFSRVTNFIHDVINPQEMPPQTRPSSERASIVDDDNSQNSMFTSHQYAGSGGEYEIISCTNLPSQIPVPREAPLDEEFWNKHKDSDGRIINVDQIKMTIFKGGVVPGLRKEVWKYLLKFYDWNMTAKEIEEFKSKKEDDYYRIKLQWKSVDEEQEKRFSLLREQKHLIEKDVARTDRRRIFYEGEENVSLKLLNDILVTYVMYNFDLGYVQGMSDLLSLILEVLGNETDAFWCFVGFMNMVEHNFDKNQHGMKQQLQNLRSLLEYLDPELFDDLKSKDSNNLYFCFRWLLVRFKRDFSFDDIQTMWEVLWTNLPCLNYHLIICVALLGNERETLMRKECGFNDILKHINELSGSIDLYQTLCKSEAIFNQLSSCKEEISPLIRHILGLR